MTKKIILGCLREPPVEYHWFTVFTLMRVYFAYDSITNPLKTEHDVFRELTTAVQATVDRVTRITRKTNVLEGT
jgi:hypothetical protein